MKKETAKRLSLLVWGWLKEHPIDTQFGGDRKEAAINAIKGEHPDAERVLFMENKCPLCQWSMSEWRYTKEQPHRCLLCPLYTDEMDCDSSGHPYTLWIDSCTDPLIDGEDADDGQVLRNQAGYAQAIYDMIAGWDVE